jgi:3-oxoacyl-[acyl-carrier protein] reductase
LVTGGARGIGSATAVMLAEHGADIVVADLRETQDARDTMAKIGNAGRRGLFVATDVSSVSSVDTLYRTAVETFGKVDILVNDAGIALTNTMANISEADWDAVIDVNLKGVFNTCKLITPDMVRRKWGRVINISSIAGRRGSLFGDVHYSSAKSRCDRFYQVPCPHLWPRQRDGQRHRPRHRENADSDKGTRKRLQSMIPLGRTAEPDELASVVLFFACGMSDYVTGTVLDVNGGSYM